MKHSEICTFLKEAVRGRSAGSFPEQRLVIEPRLQSTMCLVTLLTLSSFVIFSSHLLYHVTHYAFMVTHSTFMDHLRSLNDLEDSKAPRAHLGFLTLLACLTVYVKVISHCTRLSGLFCLCQNTGRKRRRERRRKSGRSLAYQVGEK